MVFVCEDDLWTVPAGGGIARRLTAGLGESSFPHLSPDGKLLAFTAREEGHAEVYVMPAEGGPARRITFLGATSFVAGWGVDGNSILFATNARQPFSRQLVLFAVPAGGGAPQPLPWGPSRHISYGPYGGVVLGRNTHDAARWKRYRGGTAGELWVDQDGTGRFERLAERIGNPTTPMWVGDRIYFLADHEGYGNLYSCGPDGRDVRRHTDHETYYARQATTDGRRIVYHAGADIFLFDPQTQDSGPVAIQWRSPSPQTSRRFVSAAEFLEDVALHPKGHSLALTTRGELFVMDAHGGPVVQLGEPQGVRYRLPSWLPDGERLVAVVDALGEEALVVFRADGTGHGEMLSGLDLGRVLALLAAPTGERVAVANHRHELIVVDLGSRSSKVLDRSTNDALAGLAWSPDGAWIAYGFPNSSKSTCLKLAHAVDGTVRQVTEPVLHDREPAFDPRGRYLYFLSERDFNPVYDNLHFDLSFPKGARPCLLTLSSAALSPFVPQAHSARAGQAAKSTADGDDRAPQRARIDFEGITGRVVAFPIPEGLYHQVLGMDDRVLFTSSQPEGALEHQRLSTSAEADHVLEAYDYLGGKHEVLVDRMTHVQLSHDGRWMLLQVADRLQLLPAGEKPPADDVSEESSHASGWIDLERVRVSIDPRAEWRQMYREAWRLQRDQFWTEDMSSVDWGRVHSLYMPLLDRVSTRAEFSDLLWEMQGELGTSHASETGGDYRTPPKYEQGFLGADFIYDRDAYRVVHIVEGDCWEPDRDSPLRRVGLDVRVGDVLKAVAGQYLSETFSPDQALVHRAGVETQLTLVGRDGEADRTVAVRPNNSERPARYREWVNANRRRVHQATGGRIGYVHVPDTGPEGFAEFHRGYLLEAARDGLIVDVRFSGGGHVSQLILERLARKRLGYRVERWGAVHPYPDDSIAGPLVALANEHTASDSDIFSHSFKLMELGPLIGKRTWGGVIAVWPRHALVDGTLTTQPEYAFWFTDVGWGLENHGTEPDIEVDITPQAYAAGEDTQLDRAIAVALATLENDPPPRPDLLGRPKLAPPKLPPRS